VSEGSDLGGSSDELVAPCGGKGFLHYLQYKECNGMSIFCVGEDSKRSSGRAEGAADQVGAATGGQGSWGFFSNFLEIW
jgi:hypothetical protein